MKKVFLTMAALVGCLVTQAQTGANFAETERKVLELFDSIRTEEYDQQRIALSEKIEYELLLALQTPTSFDYPFESLSALGKIYSDDRQLRVYTWNVPVGDGSRSVYGGIVQQKQAKEQPYTVISLKAKGTGYVPPVDKVLQPNEWYGALYYKVLAVKTKNKPYYVLLGWSANDDITDFKVIESLGFDRRNRLLLGQNVFRMKRNTLSRVVFEYGNQYRMTLDYDRRTKRIVCDHLAPSDSQYQGIPAYYGPDFSYDAFVLNKNRWQIEEDIEVKNTPEQEKPVLGNESNLK